MKIKNNIIKDFKKRQNYKQYEISNFYLKLLFNNQILNLKLNNKKFFNLNNFSSFSTKPRNICLFTNRFRGNIISYKLNRTIFKLLINEAKLCGIKNASW